MSRKAWSKGESPKMPKAALDLTPKFKEWPAALKTPERGLDWLETFFKECELGPQQMIDAFEICES